MNVSGYININNYLILLNHPGLKSSYTVFNKEVMKFNDLSIKSMVLV